MEMISTICTLKDCLKLVQLFLCYIPSKRLNRARELFSHL